MQLLAGPEMTQASAAAAAGTPALPHPTTTRTLSHGGWTVAVARGPISGEADLRRISEALGSPLALPEMLFGSSHLTLTHEASGAQVRFSAESALAGWVRADLPPLQVSIAQGWKATRERDIATANASVITYDWTYTTDYIGDVRDSTGGSLEAAFAATTTPIDRALLLARDPILFTEEVPLYESELDDNGVCVCSVRVRVMPRCWFVLLRFWLRVDGTVVRLREARYFAKFDEAARVVREVKHAEGTYEELGASGGPMTDAAFADADAAATVLQAVAPVGVKLYRLERLDL